MNKLFKSWRQYLNESTAYGGDRPGIAGTMHSNPGFSTNIYKDDKDQGEGEDIKQVVKAVMSLNNKVILLRNEEGWDLPGGHMKQSENPLAALEREVYEEIGLNIMDPKLLHYKHDNQKFFKGSPTGGEIHLSDEHREYGYFDLDRIREFNEEGTLSDEYLSAIEEALNDTYINNENLI